MTSIVPLAASASLAAPIVHARTDPTVFPTTEAPGGVVRAQDGAAASGGEIEVVAALAAALRVGDAKRVRSLFAADAGYAYGADAPLTDGETFDRWLESDIVGSGAVFSWRVLPRP